jgi:hypothetical protein
MIIWKWFLSNSFKQTLLMPPGAKILTVQIQNGEPHLWALCDEALPKTERTLCIYGTGIPITENLGEYIGPSKLMEVLMFSTFSTTPLNN